MGEHLKPIMNLMLMGSTRKSNVDGKKSDNKGRKMKHPVQPLYHDDQGTLRFKENKIVCFLLDAGPFDMNQLACMPFNNEDREQFAQLIGYSLCGFGELSYVSDETYNKAEKMKPVKKENEK